MPIAGGWRGHVIGQYRHRKGSGAVAHAPLDFSDPGSRGTVFLGLENKQRLGPVTQRMLSLTWMPDSLADQGLGSPSREDRPEEHTSELQSLMRIPNAVFCL